MSDHYDRYNGMEKLLSTNLAEVGTDAVSRKAVKELAYSQIRSMYCGVALKEQRETMLRIADNVIGLLAPVTSAEPKRIRGTWVGSETQCGIACSVCGVAVDDFCHSVDYMDLDYEPNFCPYCGADMRQKGENYESN